jgi:hypothetical protein
MGGAGLEDFNLIIRNPVGPMFGYLTLDMVSDVIERVCFSVLLYESSQ